MKKYLLIKDNGRILDKVVRDSRNAAIHYFRMSRLWEIGKIMSEEEYEEYIKDLKEECNHDALEALYELIVIGCHYRLSDIFPSSFR